MILKETIFKKDGNTVISEGGFKNRKEIFEVIKKVLERPHDVIYALMVHDECEFMWNGEKRRFEIIRE